MLEKPIEDNNILTFDQTVLMINIKQCSKMKYWLFSLQLSQNSIGKYQPTTCFKKIHLIQWLSQKGHLSKRNPVPDLGEKTYQIQTLLLFMKTKNIVRKNLILKIADIIWRITFPQSLIIDWININMVPESRQIVSSL